MSKEMLELCPFCGKQPVMLAAHEDDSFVRGYSICCDECGIEISDEYKDEVTKNWNRRYLALAASSDIERAFQDACDEAGCAYDNEALLEAISALKSAAAPTREEIIEQCAKAVGDMRQSEAGLFDAAHSGQRGCDRSDALYDAYRAILALKAAPAK